MDAIVTRHHNEPPLADRLALDHAELVKEATEAAALVPDQIRAIADDEEAAAFTDTAADIRAILAQADAAFKAEKEPWLEGGRTVESFFAFRKTLDGAVRRVRAALDNRANLLLAQRRKAEAEEAERARLAAAAETERLRKEAEAFDEPPPAVVAPVYVAPAPVKDVARVVSSATGNKAAVSTKWMHELTDRAAVPREYLMVDDDAIKLAIKRGVRTIAGVRIFETAKTAFRR
jgi:hypothetical protein